MNCLEALEPHVKAIAEKQHIDYQFSGLEDDASDNDDYSSYQDDCSDDGELSFDYEINDKDQYFVASRGSMDVSSMIHIFCRPLYATSSVTFLIFSRDLCSVLPYSSSAAEG